MLFIYDAQRRLDQKATPAGQREKESQVVNPQGVRVQAAGIRPRSIGFKSVEG